MYAAQVEGHTFEISAADDDFLVNGERVSCDVVQVHEGYFHIRMRNRGFRAEIIESDLERKRLMIKVNGRIYPVTLKDRFDVLLEKMGMNSNAAARVNHVRAPMPGLIMALKVKEGDAVKAGDTLLILEAMKMENMIKAPGDAIVKTVKARIGDGVEKNQVLIEFSPA